MSEEALQKLPEFEPQQHLWRGNRGEGAMQNMKWLATWLPDQEQGKPHLGVLMKDNPGVNPCKEVGCNHLPGVRRDHYQAEYPTY